MRTPSAELVTAVSGLMLSLLICPGCRRAQDTGTAPQVIKTSTGLEMVAIPAGWFEMGSAKGEPDEAPPHRVWVDSFLLDKYEVVQGQYTKLVGANPSSFKGPGKPVDTVTWTDAVLYCNLRSRAEGLESCYHEESGTWQCDFKAPGYRLPTEAEWEYACRAGTESEYYFGSDLRTWKNTPGTRATRSGKPTWWGKKNLIPGGFMTCTAMWPNGAMMCMARTTIRRARPRIPADLRKEK